jgi:hypothetical protein
VSPMTSLSITAAVLGLNDARQTNRP